MIKVGVFCDVENVVQFEKLLKFIRDEIGKEGKTLWKAVANLINALSLQGWRVITKPVRTLPYDSIKANMDLDMAIEILQTSPYLVGKRVWVIGTRKGSVAIDIIRVQGFGILQ